MPTLLINVCRLHWLQLIDLRCGVVVTVNALPPKIQNIPPQSTQTRTSMMDVCAFSSAHMSLYLYFVTAMSRQCILGIDQFVFVSWLVFRSSGSVLYADRFLLIQIMLPLFFMCSTLFLLHISGNIKDCSGSNYKAKLLCCYYFSTCEVGSLERLKLWKDF